MKRTTFIETISLLNEWLNAVPTESSDKIQPNNNFYEETTSSNNNV